MKIDEFRKQYPQYDDMSDEEVSKNLHKRYYSDMDYESFSKKFYPPSLLERAISTVKKAKVRPLSEAEKDIGVVGKGGQANFLRSIAYHTAKETGKDISKIELESIISSVKDKIKEGFTWDKIVDEFKKEIKSTLSFRTAKELANIDTTIDKETLLHEAKGAIKGSPEYKVISTVEKGIRKISD